jgi:ElaB/YqjD/DUF883 family membrane-anchored ribosome-binding protein
MADEDQMKHGATSSQSGTIGQEHGQQRTGAERKAENLKASPRKHRSQGEQMWEEARERFRTLKQDTDEYVRNNPAKAVFTALGIGFVLALMRRR